MITSIIATFGPVLVKIIMMVFDHMQVKKENKKKFLQDIMAKSNEQNALHLAQYYEKLLGDDGWKKD